MELVAEAGGIKYYADSKATNVGAAAAALEGLEAKAVLIAGGRDKGGDYGPLRDQLEAKGRAVVLIGEAADRIEGAVSPVVSCHRAESLEAAVALARGLAEPGDAVLLAPACSSFDMFRNYLERGEVFARAVKSLVDAGGSHDVH